MTVIKNIGYMWHRKYVDWEKISLKGYSEDDNEEIDFSYQAGIYSLYNQNFDCIYIGQAGRGDNTGLFHRLKTHAVVDELFCMWERFSWFGFYSTETVKSGSDEAYKEEFDKLVDTNINELMNVIESMIIRIHNPRFNKSIGSLKKDKHDDPIEWFYQKAEFEEREAEFNDLKNRCPSLNK